VADFGVLLVKKADYDAEIPFAAVSRLGAVGILRLRLAGRFALRQTSLRMTEGGDGAGM
jgi:hypothetical protein